MKSLFASVFAASLIVLGSYPPGAQAAPPAWNCNMTFDVSGAGLQFIVGYFELSGTGYMTCIDAERSVVVTPIKVALGGSPLAARAAIVPYMRVHGGASNVGLPEALDDIYGTYAVVDARGSFIVGGGVNATLKNPNGVTFRISLDVASGFGVEAGLDSLRIMPR